MKPTAPASAGLVSAVSRQAVRSILFLGAVLALGPAGLAWAEDYDEERSGRGVARISVVNGDVSVRRGDSGDWVAAAVNAPLVVQDHVVTGSGSRAEVQFDWANLIRLAGNSEIRLSELEHGRYQVQIARGTVTFRVLRNSDAEVELSTPNVSVRPLRKGMYRILVREDGESEITVRSGEAEVYTPRGVERLKSGRTMLARGSRSDPEFRIVRAADWDSWDRWNEQRDRYLERARGYRYAHRSVYGIEDLDYYGDWEYIPPYGWCWAPRVVVGWAPYYYGRWAWIDWYGWSWISYDPWGWAPYHYGRWFWHGRRWCWWPGGYFVRHYWRPALVAFFGWGPHSGFHAGFSFGWGHIGWVPLAPYEPFYPWYGHLYYRGYGRHTYIDNSVNIVNNINITNVYRNARVYNGVTAVDASQFGRGGNLVRVNPDEIRRAGLVKGQLPLAPGRESLRWSDREVRAPNIARSVPERGFYSRRQPAPVERVPFEQQQRALQESIARTPQSARGDIPRGPEGGPRTETAAGRIPRGTGREGAQGRESGLRPVSPDRSVESAAAPPRGAEPRSGSADGWRRFGEPRSETVTGSAPRGASPEDSRGGQDSLRALPGGRDAGGPDTGIRSRPESRPGSEGGWRRFGEPRTERPSGTDRDSSRGGVIDRSQRFAGDAGSEGWRRLGEIVIPGERREAPSGSGWRRFGEPGRSGHVELVRPSESARPMDRMPGEPRSRTGEEGSSGLWRQPRAPAERRDGEMREFYQRREPRFERPRWETPPSDRFEAPRIERSAPQRWSDRAPRYDSPRPMERTPSRGGGRFEGGVPRGGGEIRSAPRGDGRGSRSGDRGR